MKGTKKLFTAKFFFKGQIEGQKVNIWLLKCGFWVGATANLPKRDDIYAQLTRGAFIINDFLQNPHFSRRKGLIVSFALEKLYVFYF